MTNLQATAQKWAKKNASPDTTDVVQAYITENPNYEYDWMYKVVSDRTSNKAWWDLRGKFDKENVLEEYLESPRADWSEAKMAAYNKSLSGKIFIPQPFAILRNAYEVQSGFGVTRYMLIEVAVALICLLLFKWLAGRIATGQPPKGKIWNLLESFVAFVRNGVVVPAMGEHDADKYMPFFWTLFMFVLGCNLMGMIPWVGAPTSVLATVGGLASMVFLIGTTAIVRNAFRRLNTEDSPACLKRDVGCKTKSCPHAANVLVMMRCITNKHGRQKRENVCLQKSHKQL